MVGSTNSIILMYSSSFCLRVRLESECSHSSTISAIPLLRCSGNLDTLSWKTLIEKRLADEGNGPCNLGCVNLRILPATPLHLAMNSLSCIPNVYGFRLAAPAWRLMTDARSTTFEMTGGSSLYTSRTCPEVSSGFTDSCPFSPI